MENLTKANKILYIMLLIILFISNLFIGTPVRYNIMYINLIVNITALICIGIKYFKNKEKISISKIDICVIIIVFSTFLPLIFSTYLRLADTVEYILRYITVLNIYMITKILTKDNKQVIDNIFDVIIFSSILLIIFGIDMMTKNVFQGFYDILGIPRIINESTYRMGSLFRYPNALGIFLVISIILSVIRYVSKENSKYRNIFAITLFIQIFGLIMTYSRLNFLLLIISLIVIILLEKNKIIRNNIIKLIITSLISSVIYFIFFNTVSKTENYISIYIILVIQSIVFYAIEKRIENLKVKNNKNICITMAVAVIIVIFSIIYSLIFSKNEIVLFKAINSEEVYRKQNISVETNQEYIVEFEIEASSNVKDNFKIQCKEIDKNGKEIEIHEERFDNYYGNKTIKFTTSESTETISIVFNNTSENSNGFLNVKSVKINGEEEKISYGIIPIELVNRITKFKTDIPSFSGRLEYYKGSIEVIKENFFTGSGGYAWKNSGQQTKTGGIAEHSYPLQLFIQNGVISFIAYAVLMIIIIKNMKRVFEDRKSFVEIGVYVIILVLSLHSLFDFDMYFFNVLIMFYVLIPMISSEESNYDIVLNHRYSYSYAIILIFGLFFSFGEVVTSIIGDKVNNYNYIEAKIVMVPYDYTFRRDKINYLSTIKNEGEEELDEGELSSIITKIIKEEEYIIEKEKNKNYDDINRLIINYIDIISSDNENEILDKIENNFEKLENNKELVYQTMKSRFKRKYFNENIKSFLEKVKRENGLREEFNDDYN